MPENEKVPGEEKLLILPLGEESRKITRVISNDTARQIIELLADGPLSATDVAERLKTPLTTIIYNLENLESVGLIRIERIKYSEKGREVKVYAPVRKLIVVVPEKADRKSLADILRRYIALIMAAVVASGIVDLFAGNRNSKMMQVSNYSNLTSSPMVPEPARELAANITATPAYIQPQVQDYAAKAAPDTLTNLANIISEHPGLLFLMGSLFVVFILIIIDYRLKKKN